MYNSNGDSDSHNDDNDDNDEYGYPGSRTDVNSTVPNDNYF